MSSEKWKSLGGLREKRKVRKASSRCGRDLVAGAPSNSSAFISEEEEKAKEKKT